MHRTPTHSRMIVAAIGLIVAGASHADSVQGRFELGGRVLEPKEVSAYRIRATKDPRMQGTLVMLTAKPLDRAAIAKDTDPYAVAINDEGVRDADYVSLRIDPDNQVTSYIYAGGTQYIDTSGQMMGQQGSLAATCTTNTPKRIACTVRTTKPVETSSAGSWSLDVTFDSEVLARTPGPALPAGGGDAGKAFLALAGVVKAGGDISKILPLLPPDEAVKPDDRTDEEHAAASKQRFAYGFPMEPTVTGGELFDENTALLEVEGQRPGRRDLYLVRMERAEGRWGFRSSLQLGRIDK